MVSTLRLAVLIGALAVPVDAAAALMDWSFAGTLANAHPDGFALAGDRVAMHFTMDTSRPDMCAADDAGLYTGVFSNASLTIGEVSFTPTRSEFGAVEINAPLGDCGRMLGGHLVDSRYPVPPLQRVHEYHADRADAGGGGELLWRLPGLRRLAHRRGSGVARSLFRMGVGERRWRRTLPSLSPHGRRRTLI